MKIKTVKFKNFRAVPDMETDLNGYNFLLVGTNRVGKSSFIKGILAAMGGNFGKGAIKNGFNQAEIEINLADFKEDQPIGDTGYSFRAVITKKGEEETVKLEVIAPNGMRETRKTVIGSIAGELELDYNFVELSKSTAGKKKQVEIVKSYLDEDILKDLSVHESKAKHLFEQRTDLGRALKACQGFIKEAGLNPDDFVKYAKPVDTKAMLQLKDEGSAHNAKVDMVKERWSIREKKIKEVKEQIDTLIKEQAQLCQQNADATQWLIENTPVSLEKLNQDIAGAEQHNKMNYQVSMLTKKQKEAAELETNVEDLTVEINLTKQAISDVVKQMVFPIEGLSYDDDNVYYHGKLVDTENMSTAEIMILEAELKMCKAPGVEVIFIQRGESMGRELLQELQAKAEEKGFQIIMEKVDMDTASLKVELMPQY